MKKALLILSALILLCIPILSCTVEPDSPAVKFATVDQIAALQKAYDTLKATVDTKANKTDVVAGVSKDYVDLKVSSVAAPNLSNYYTKAEVNDAVKKAIDEYKATLTGSTGGTVPTSGQVTISRYKDADLVYNEGTYTWWLEISNGYTEYKKVYISMVLTPVETANGDVVAWNSNYTSPTGTYIYSPDLPATDNSKGIFSMSYVPTTPTNCTLISGSSQGYVIIKGNDKKVIPISLTLDYSTTDATRWEATFSHTALKYP